MKKVFDIIRRMAQNHDRRLHNHVDIKAHKTHPLLVSVVTQIESRAQYLKIVHYKSLEELYK